MGVGDVAGTGPDGEADVGGWVRQVRRGVLDLALLCRLSDGPAHGYALIAALKHAGLMPAQGAEATVYQALQRLARQGLAEAAWTSGAGGDRPRKTYKITPAGHRARAAMAHHWQSTTQAVDKLLETFR